jgi:putative DNA primase/helicase
MRRPSMRTTSAHVLEMLREAASRARGRGRWRRAACPLCGAGKRGDDALAVSVEGHVKCHRCGVTARLTDAEPERDEPAAADDTARRREWALRLIEQSTAIEPGSPVDRYLRGRGLRPTDGEGWPANVRSVHTKHPKGRTWPCMLGIVRDATGRVVGAHRTYLDRDGRKAPVKPVRLSLGTLRGAAVRLGPFSPTILVGEGIETALAAAMLLPDLGSPWAALSAGGLAALNVPATVERVTVAMDHDPAGERGARRLRTRLERFGIVVRLVRPTTKGADACDLLARGGART